MSVVTRRPAVVEDYGRAPALIHHASRIAWLWLVIAGVGTAFRPPGLVWTGGAAVTWIGFGAVALLSAVHEWDVCPICSVPPSAVATAKARLQLATRVHSPRRARCIQGFTIALVWHALMPLPSFVHALGWRAGTAAAYVAAVSYLYKSFQDSEIHEQYSSECPSERCRAGGVSAPPGMLGRLTAHYGPWALLALVPGLCILGVVALNHPALKDEYDIGLLATTAILLTVVGFHTDDLCLECVKRLPTNGAQLAERRHFWLQAAHRLRITAPVTGMILWTCSWLFTNSLPGMMLIFAGFMSLVTSLFLRRVHGRVQPWCPWCRDPGNGGDCTAEGAPDPTDRRPLPV